MNYTQEAIFHVTEFIKGNDAARAWLQKNHYPELILLQYALNGNDEALKELAYKKHIELTAFVHAVQDDKRAFNWLAQNKKFIWAATVRVTYNDKNAEVWLVRNQLPHYAELGKAIRKNEENESADDVFGLMKKFIRFLKNPYKR